MATTMPAAHKVNPADPRVKRTRQLLMDAFMEMLTDKSFVSISIQDIARRATVNRATFYAHFQDKYDLFDHVIREQFRAVLDGKVPPPSQFELDDVPVLARVVLEYLASIQDHCRVRSRRDEPPIEAKVQDEVYRFLLAWLKQASPSGLRSPLSPDLAAAMMSWAIFGVGVQWSRATATGARSPVEQIVGELSALLVGGLSRHDASASP